MRKLFIILIGVCLCVQAATSARAQEDNRLAKFRLKRIDGTEIHGMDGELRNGYLYGYSVDGSILSVPVDSITSLKQQMGNNLGIGLVLGAILGATGSYGFSRLIADDGPDANATHVASLTVGAVFFGAVGAAIGKRTSNWREVDISTETSGLQGNGMYARVSIHF